MYLLLLIACNLNPLELINNSKINAINFLALSVATICNDNVAFCYFLRRKLFVMSFSIKAKNGKFVG